MSRTLLSFVDLKDPFLLSDVAGEELTGPVLSMLAARSFDAVHLFYTGQASENAIATRQAIGGRYSKTAVQLHEIRCASPKDYSGIMGAVAREVRHLHTAENYVCVSSGTAEMRATWFLLTASGVLNATLLQIGSPAEPLFGPAHVQEVEFDGQHWSNLRDLVMPQAYFEEAPAEEQFTALLSPQAPPAPAPPPSRLPEVAADIGLYIGSATLQLEAEKVEMAAPTNEPLLLLGETGTGKELFARLAHRLSERAHRPMITVNCGALAANLVDDHLFGHVKGAFTDAKTDRAGAFEEADGATIFLDEVGELSLEAQVKLLRVLGNGEVQRIGSNKVRRVDVRVIAATNRNLPQLMADKGFREDLYYRLAIVPIHVPPLRNRRSEIAELAAALMKNVNARAKRPKQLSKAALVRLEQHAWPGNVRELLGVLQRSAILCPSDVLGADDLRFNEVPTPNTHSRLPEPQPGFDLNAYMETIRRQLILRALELANNNQSRAADLLGISKQAVNQFVNQR